MMARVTGTSIVADDNGDLHVLFYPASTRDVTHFRVSSQATGFRTLHGNVLESGYPLDCLGERMAMRAVSGSGRTGFVYFRPEGHELVLYDAVERKATRFAMVEQAGFWPQADALGYGQLTAAVWGSLDEGEALLVRVGPQRKQLIIDRADTATGSVCREATGEPALAFPEIMGSEDQIRVYGYAGEYGCWVYRRSGGGRSWVRERIVDSSGSSADGQYCVVRGAQGMDHWIGAQKNRNDDLELTHAQWRAGRWATETVAVVGWSRLSEDVLPELQPSACFDASGRLHVAFYDFVRGVLMHAVRQPSGWRLDRVASVKSCACPSIAATSNTVAIAYADVARGDFVVAWAPLRKGNERP